NFHYAIDPRLLACAGRTALVDIDPGLLQFWMSTGQLNVPAHDCYLTTGETVGTPAARFSDCGLQWTHIRPPVCLDLRPVTDVAGSPEAYRAYVQQSRGEFSCAKPSCMEFQNAWVSDRTLCYLASGKPVVVQHTGPSSYLPHGEGMFRFTSLPEAVEALESIASDYARHCRAARDIAETHFDARRVLDTALNAALSTQPAALQRAGA